MRPWKHIGPHPRQRKQWTGESLARERGASLKYASATLKPESRKVELFLEFYTQQIVSLVNNAGLRVENKSVRRIAAGKVGWNSTESGWDSALLRPPQDRRRRARDPAHRRRVESSPGGGAPADAADPASLPVRRDAEGSPRQCIS
ncbi:unnamed protein product, partial [Prorocentrum cordatum]